jgi:hypothetical protein
MVNWLKTALVAAVFLFAMFVVLELSYRVYLFGPTGFSPAKVGSFSLIFSSGLVQPAANRDVWYELKPDQNTLFRGAPFRTNAQGLADDEYPLEKPANTIRVAVLGASWAMGSGVKLEETFHSVLERQFNSAGGSVRYEFINFGVEFYGLQEIVATVRHKVLPYDPDFIMVEVTAYTPTVRWTSHDTEFVPLPHRNKAWDSLLVQRVSDALGRPSVERQQAGAYRESLGVADWDGLIGQIERAFDELADISSANGIPVGVALLRANVRNDYGFGKKFVSSALERGIAVADINLDIFLQPGESVGKLMVSRAEPHPNPYGHELIARELRRQIFDANPLFQAPADR